MNIQALKTYNYLLSIFSRVHGHVKTKLTLFDALVVPIYFYMAQVCGIYNTNDVEKLHSKFCKLLIGMRPQTSNTAVFGELGRFPLSVRGKQKALSYWAKIMNKPDSLMYNVFTEQCNLYNAN